MKTSIGILAMTFLLTWGLQLNAQQTRRGSCVNGISNLTEEQKTAISALETSYQSQMADYRTDRQGTMDLEQKKEIREKMITARDQHRKQVNELLNSDQQKEYAGWIDARKERWDNSSANVGHRGQKAKKGKAAKRGKGQGKNRSGAGKGACLNNN
ncbi:hypothetical protein [Mangrovibacterium marinum]|uniref:Spy/CpxP family protein refolding chaperone n=1 Tax=Mangrovibacterium marinum TaxID=1639118 RepID=A0A2T5BXP1_9BACT|nr:hypothetical protein [Mangrovibacterium marinum]PTN05601.1 hypothetical protein C8N47_12620 [Mangrovibacterium marinum]